MVSSLLKAIGIHADGPPTRKGEVYDRIHAELPRIGEDRVGHLAAFAGLLARAIFLKKAYGISYAGTAGVFGLMIIHAACVFVLLLDHFIVLDLSIC